MTHDKCPLAKGIKSFKCITCGRQSTNYSNGIDQCDYCCGKQGICQICGEPLRPDKKSMLDSPELLEILAYIEHQRWAGWQKYLHSLCVKNEDGSLTIPKERVDWWEQEIETPYSGLTEKLKEYDRAEVRKTLEAIKLYIGERDK